MNRYYVFEFKDLGDIVQGVCVNVVTNKKEAISLANKSKSFLCEIYKNNVFSPIYKKRLPTK